MLTHLRPSASIFSRKISLMAFATELGLTTRRVQSLFSEKTGMTFVSFFRDLRIRRAEKLLAKTPQQIKEISALLGYQNVESFCRDFRLVSGCTAGEFRRHFRKRQ